MTDIVQVEHLTKTFRGRGFREQPVHAVKDVSFTLAEGDSVGLVGESGSGKSTTGRVVCGLERATTGSVVVSGASVGDGVRDPQAFYTSVQMIFQDPYSSLNPRMTIRESLGYALKIRGVAGAEREQRVRGAVAQVGLPSATLDRYPHQLSTGQRQRAGVARAVITRPKLIVADEPVSALDVSLQTQILNLLVDIQEETGVAYLFISHDLAVVAYLCERVLVMRGGEIVEQGPSGALLAEPQTDYGRLLVQAAGIGDRLKAG